MYTYQHTYPFTHFGTVGWRQTNDSAINPKSCSLLKIAWRTIRRQGSSNHSTLSTYGHYQNRTGKTSELNLGLVFHCTTWRLMSPNAGWTQTSMIKQTAPAKLVWQTADIPSFICGSELTLSPYTAAFIRSLCIYASCDLLMGSSVCSDQRTTMTNYL